MSNVDILNEYFNSSECINLEAQVAWFKLVEEKFKSPNTVSTQCPHWELDEPDEGEITHCCYHPDKLLWARRT